MATGSASDKQTCQRYACARGQLHPQPTLAAYSCMLSQVGHSQPSAIAMLRTGFTVPKCPGAPRVTGATKSTVTLAWKAPEETGGSQVIDYEAEIQPKSKAAMEGGKADDWMLVYQVRTADMILVSFS